MRYLLAFLLCLGLAAGQPWTPQDKILEGTALAAWACDWAQTSDIHRYDRHETNSFLGRHPEQSTINMYFLAGAALHVVIADQLSGKWRTVWQCSWIELETTAVERNCRLGIRVSF
jgi:hypothetical protein